ncbi:NACHT, LRR and PYD domains-containing protein 12-like [Clupea harengus]|uniref:NACHT, LRR and PYD domains-containing protein 12-like n=1 Tax=Clupea harengus TaxID=7950 RepID=A0A6P8EZB8_CLUHA|nr:NACHT, LRR and PYD domains-containing protein 12-like [Clupea harengus]
MFLCSGLSSSHCKLTKLSLAKCALTKDACGYVASALKANSTLTKLELSHNDVTDLGVEMLCDGLMSAQCRLSSLRLAACHLTYESCTSLANALQGEESSLRELNLNYNDLGDLGVKLLCDGNQCINANSKIQMLKLSECSLTEDSCEYLAYVLQSPSSNLKNLQLRDNDLQDTGVMLLSAGIKHANCRLQSLGLAGCGIKEDGFYSLAHALDCNPLHLEQLCLNFNNPRAQGIVSLFDQKSDPKYKLDTLILDSSEAFQLNPGPRKYFCPLTLDDRVPHDMDFISLRDKSVSTGSSMDASQYEIMLSKEALTKRCYWEVEVSGDRVEIGVSSRAQKSRRADDQMGQSGFFPCLVIYLNKLHGFLQNGEIMADCPDLDCPQRIGLYLNKNAECLSFYSVCEDKLTLLAKFPSTGFTKVTSAGKLFAACRIYSNSEAKLIS